MKQTAVRQKALSLVCGGIIVLTAVFDLIRVVSLGALIPVITALVLESIILLVTMIAFRSDAPFLMLVPGIGGIILFGYMNNIGTTLFYLGFLIQAIASFVWAILGTGLLLWKKQRPSPPDRVLCILLAVLLLCIAALWGTMTWRAKSDARPAARQIWAVPTTWDTGADAPAGMVVDLAYETRAYATNSRNVTKHANVYLPAGYDPQTPYNILYLLHGTRDDENYWLKTFPYNTVMLDRLIDAGEIQQLIVVTPTFYVEDDCKDDLEPLTYAFREEIRNDLMPAVESQFSTFAATADDTGFAESRDHRAFAGLSRGAVTTYRSVLGGCLDYFSYFGTFSGSRTDASYLSERIQSGDLSSLPIHYLYVSSGNFDFALPGQLKDYASLLSAEPRLTKGVNTSFDIFPMRYHSMGDWHLALYNFLQKIF